MMTAAASTIGCCPSARCPCLCTEWELTVTQALILAWWWKTPAPMPQA